MQIIADQEGKEAIRALCDMALKVGGLQNHDFVNTVLSGTSLKEQENTQDGVGK